MQVDVLPARKVLVKTAEALERLPPPGRASRLPSAIEKDRNPDGFLVAEKISDMVAVHVPRGVSEGAHAGHDEIEVLVASPDLEHGALDSSSRAHSQNREKRLDLADATARP